MVRAKTLDHAGGGARRPAGRRKPHRLRDPDGKDFPNRGVFLEVVPNQRLVFTDAYTEGWQPSEKPFFTAILTFEDVGGKTKYTAYARHWTAADREAHEKMGFHEGWGQCADQLATVAATLRP